MWPRVYNIFSKLTAFKSSGSSTVCGHPAFHRNLMVGCRTLSQRPDSTDDSIISNDLVHHLERTSLVDFDNAEAIKRLTEAISFANQLFEVNTEGVEPLISVLENEALPLRDDVAEPTSRKDITRNASVIEEDYFVAPPGNIPLEKSAKEFLK